MSLQITSDSFHLRPETAKLVSEKIKKIEKLLIDVGEELKDIRVVINKGPRFGFVAKVELWIPSGSFVAKAGGFTIEGTLDDAIEEMASQVKKHKGKVFRRDRKLLRRFKNFLFLHESQT